MTNPGSPVPATLKSARPRCSGHLRSIQMIAKDFTELCAHSAA
jgi:hypothetical protein